jgi:hypothetical protein
MKQQRRLRGQRGTITGPAEVIPVGCGLRVSTDVEADDFNGDIVELWGKDSFPASDPPANW